MQGSLTISWDLAAAPERVSSREFNLEENAYIIFLHTVLNLFPYLLHSYVCLQRVLQVPLLPGKGPGLENCSLDMDENFS